jgi:hypothetical protein
VALVVTFMWVTAAITSLFDEHYVVLEVISPVMLLLAGDLFGVEIIRPGNGRRNGNGNGNGNENGNGMK